MRARRSLSFVAGVSALVLASLAVASPASAAVLPDGQRISVIDLIFDFEEPGINGHQMYEVSPADGAATAVGPVEAPFSVTAVDVNDDGLGFATANVASDESREPYLYKANAVTGVLSDPVLITNPGFDLSTCDGLDLQPNGEIIVACNAFEEEADVSYIGTVSPAGEFVPFITSGVNDVPLVDFAALAYDAVTGELWAFADNDGTARYLVDREAHTFGPVLFMPFRVYGADFDRSGQLFITTYDSAIEDFAIATLVPSTGVRTLIGPYTVGAETLSPVWAITVWGKPALAATGSSDVDATPVALGSALLLLAGAAFIATARMNRRRTA
jgi:hypothetical protein